MARVLIGWELGANRGHAARIAELARQLRALGHETLFALQRLDALSPREAGGAPVWQAPLTPRMLVSVPQGRRDPPAGMADILARLGFDDAELVAAVIRGWERLIAALRPDLVLADFAPFLLLAARGRLPTVLLGTGFSVPPAGMADFPRLIEGPRGVDQAALLATVNEGLAAAGAAAIERLPEAFAADRPVAASFAELDPYAPHRVEPLIHPLADDFDAAAGEGEEVFVYAPELIGDDSPLWHGLKAAGVPVRVHVPRASPDRRRAIAGFGFAVEPEPLPFAAIARRSRLLVSHGGHGFVCAGLAAGLPQVVCHYDLEKLLNGRALARLGLGGHVPLMGIRPEAFGPSLAALYRDEALAGRARAATPGFRGRAGRTAAEAALEAVAALA